MALDSEQVIQIIDMITEGIQLENNGGEGYSNYYIAEMVLESPSAESTIRRIKKELLSTGSYRGIVGNMQIAGGTISEPDTKRGQFKGDRFIITSAQNNTLIHDKFYKSLMVYAEHNNSELIVSTFDYNKNSFKNTHEDLWFDERIRDSICDKPMQIAKDLVFCGEFNILPTAVTPLSGLYNYTGSESGIIPHAKMQLESIPTPKHDTPKMLYTTGCLTQMNYIQKKSGTKAEWHHIFGALAVEIDEDGEWFVRQLVANSETGEFYDLDVLYTPKGIKENQSIEAINYGDIHAAGLSEMVADVSWRKNKLNDSILDVLRPKYQFLHDVHDQRARNHHNVKDPHFMFKMYHNQTESVKDEIFNTAQVIKETIRDFSQTIIVESNHNLAVTQWLKEMDYKRDPVNAIFFLEMQTAIYKAIARGESLAVFEYACKILDGGLDDVLFLREDESFRIAGNIECGSHGHLGNSGSRGGIQTYLKLGIKHNLGHVHGAAIREGVYYAGMSGELEQGYNKGGSSWNHSHILTYVNGKRAIITLKNGKWRA